MTSIRVPPPRLRLDLEVPAGQLGALTHAHQPLGYATAAVFIVVGAVAPHPFLRQFSWLPGVGLAAYTATTIVAYMVIGPYFSLGFIAKGIEIALIGLLVLDVMRVYGSPAGLVRATISSVTPFLPARSRPQAA